MSFNKLGKQMDTEENKHEQLDPKMDIDLRRLELMAECFEDPISRAWLTEQLWRRWVADFHLYIVSPTIESIVPPVLIKPEIIAGTQETEFVYSIYDSGSELSTSKAEDMLATGFSMCRLFFTIEKMIYILVERLKSGGITTDYEVKVSFGGHLLAQRKAFESIINLNYNVVVTNFAPGSWGESYLNNVKQNINKYGYPPESPRRSFRQPHKDTHTGPKKS